MELREEATELKSWCLALPESIVETVRTLAFAEVGLRLVDLVRRRAGALGH